MGILDEVEEVIEDLTGGNRSNDNAAANQQGILPASQDPYGDPADAAAGIRPASEDPYGDPGR